MTHRIFRHLIVKAGPDGTKLYWLGGDFTRWTDYRGHAKVFASYDEAAVAADQIRDHGYGPCAATKA